MDNEDVKERNPRKYWKIAAWIPVIMLIVAATIVINNISTTGSILEKDVELAGGRMITLELKDGANLAQIQNEFPDASVQMTTGLTKTLIVEISFETDENEVIQKLEELVDFEGEPNVKIVGPALGDIFFRQAQFAIIGAFVLMGILVFILFRTVVPSTLVIFAAVTDIVVTISVMDVLGIKLSLAVLVALLTLIGYSVDTDILLTSELLKRKYDADIKDKIKKVMKTGLTLTITTLVALFAIYFVSSSLVLEQIALVLIIGLIVDVIVTWAGNAGFLRIWLERKGRI